MKLVSVDGAAIDPGIRNVDCKVEPRRKPVRGKPGNVSRPSRRSAIRGHLPRDYLRRALVKQLRGIPRFDVDHTRETGELANPAGVDLHPQVCEVEYTVGVNNHRRRKPSRLSYLRVVSRVVFGFAKS